VGQRIFATFFAFGYVLPLSVIAIFSLCIVRHLSRVEKSASRTLGANKQKRHGKDKKRHDNLATSGISRRQGEEPRTRSDTTTLPRLASAAGSVKSQGQEASRQPCHVWHQQQAG